ncbi:MAG: hypothetical protein GF313_16350 [Caldithrix sp.]|nr:hypothetical protein [Caldithrix sp.]
MKKLMNVLKSLWLLVVVLIVMLAAGVPLWILIPILIILLAVPLLREFNPRSDLDERQLYISRLTSHVSLYVMNGLILFVLIREYFSHNQQPPSYWYMILLIPLVLKFMMSLFENYSPVLAAQWIGGFFASVWLLFVLLSHGFSLTNLMESVPFLLILVSVLLIRKRPLIAGFAFLILAAGLLIFFRAWLSMDVYVRLLMYTLLPMPLLICGVALIWHHKKERKEQ